jgi:glycerol-3-phosphate acyltransferase PlsX
MTGSSSAVSRIALDVMGGDNAPDEILKGAIAALAEYPVELLLVGQAEVIRARLAALGTAAPARTEIVDAREVVEMEDNALAPLRKKRNSSIRVCANLVAEGKADALVSAGHTGATWTSSKAVIGMIEGVSRPALAQTLPRFDGVTLLLDVGANVHAKPENLREFAVMGHFYAQIILGIAEPRVGLLSIGEEEGKGNDLTKDTFRILQETGLNFIGNAEGRDIFNGRADVIVCDGFVGNVVLKASEALGEMVWKSLKSEFSGGPIRKTLGAMVYPLLKGLKKRTDWREYGGAPLLGVNSGCIVCHGRSDALAIKNAIRVAREFALNRIGEKIQKKIGDLHTREHDALAESAK